MDASFAMAAVIESVVLAVRPGLEADFEAAFALASPLIARAKGYRGHTLRVGIEVPHTYLLTVGWDSVEDHERGFRGSLDYERWRELLHRFYDPVPQVLHYGDHVNAAPSAEPF